MEYEEIELLKQGENGSVHLIREKTGGQFFVRKVMKGQHPVYLALQGRQHPYLPKLYEVAISDEATTVIEAYIEGQPLGCMNLSGKQFLGVVKDLCVVLEFLHGMGIIHRDIKPSNIIYTESGHICLVDFDAAREMKEKREQDTRLLGTRGYAPPEQYGFSQTDVRTDIYSLGITLEQILQNRFQKLRYRRRLKKCTELDPNKRYQSIRQVRRAFFHTERDIVSGFAAIVAAVLIGRYFLEGGVADLAGTTGSAAASDKPAAIAGNNAPAGSVTSAEPAISAAPGIPAAERYPNQVLWNDFPVHDYLGRYIDIVMEEMDAECDEYTEGGDDNVCAYREAGILFCFDRERKIYQIVVDPAYCTYNGEALNVNRDKVLEILGEPFLMGWTQWGLEGVPEEYFIDYYDGEEGFRIYMPSPEAAATDLYID